MALPVYPPAFESLIQGLRHLVSLAQWNEQRLTALVNRAEAPDHDGLSSLLPGLRESCVTAREQRMRAEALLSQVGSTTGDGTRPPPRPRVLIVDDSADTRELIATLLEGAGLEVVTAANGLEGLIAAHDLRPAVILMDLNMPILDGIETTRLLKAADRTRDITVIAHTAKPDFTAGAVGRLFARVLPKPTPPDVFLESILQYVLPPPEDSQRLV